MSMHITVYLGPYLEVSGISQELVEEFESLVACGRGELRCGESHRYLVPNQPLEGVDRPLRLGRGEGDPPPPLDMSEAIMSWEKGKFYKGLTPLLERLKALEIDYRICWGVVCGIF